MRSGANGSGGPSGKQNGRFRHGQRTQAVLAVLAQHKQISALVSILRATAKSVVG